MMRIARNAYPGVTAANIVAVVHSHPREGGSGFESVTSIGQLSPLDYGNTMPSHPNIGGLGDNDWANVRSFLVDGGHANPDAVSQFILGPDGILR